LALWAGADTRDIQGAFAVEWNPWLLCLEDLSDVDIKLSAEVADQEEDGEKMADRETSCSSKDKKDGIFREFLRFSFKRKINAAKIYDILLSKDN